MLQSNSERSDLDTWQDEGTSNPDGESVGKDDDKICNIVNNERKETDDEVFFDNYSLKRRCCLGFIFVFMFVILPISVVLGVVVNFEKYEESEYEKAKPKLTFNLDTPSPEAPTPTNSGYFFSSPPEPIDPAEAAETSGIPPDAADSRVIQYPEYTMEAFFNPSSPQSRAQEWVMTDPNLDNYSDSKIMQRFALVTLFYATQGESWFGGRSWLAYDMDECEWFTYSDQPCSNGQYINLNVEDHGLSGTIPPELALLTSLIEINFRGNNLIGPIPTQIESLTNLRYLDLHNNVLTGTLPIQLFQLSGLQSFLLTDNDFHGSIPDDVGLLSNVERFSVRGNSLSGTLPSELGYLTSAKYLLFAQNNITGTIPSTLGRLSNLQWLQLEETELEGSVPAELCSWVDGSVLRMINVDCENVQCDCGCDCAL